MKQLDVHNVFLNWDLLEGVYMMQPTGFEGATHPQHIVACGRQYMG